MALPIRPNNPNIPIPNTSFSAPLNAYVNGPYFPVVMGTGIDVTTGAKVADLNNQGVLEFSGATGDINLLAGTGISVVETTVGNNTDFTISNTGVVSLVAGSGISLSAASGTVTISAAAGPGGTVTSVGTGVGLTGGPITSSGTISLDVSGVAPGSYTYPSITVDAYGRITVAANGTAPVTAITGTAPVQVTGTAPTLNVAVAAASTTAPGVVQLNNTATSTSTTQALTANQGKLLQDQINAISVASNITLAGTLDASTGNLTTVTSEGIAAGFTIGSPLPAAAAGNDNYFVIASVAAASYTPPGGSATVVHVGDWFLSDATSWQFLDVGDSSGGTVTSVATTAALTGGPITTSGTLDLAVTGVTAGTVIAPASVTVDACGRITALGAATNPVTEADFQAKGDLIAGFGVNSYGVVGVGSNGQVLSVNSSCAGGMEWVTPAAGAGSATPTVEGLVFGCTDTTNFNYGLGDGIFGALTTGTLNIAIGSSALASTDTGTSNTAVGIGALYSTTSGTQNVALGQQALFSNVSGGLNVAVGSNALQNTTGDANTALGNFAGNLITTGCSNILIGNQAGGAGAGALDTGNNNVVIGNCVSPASNSADCQLAIGVNTVCWLTGDSTGAIKPGAGVIDCANSCGTAGQVLMSNGSNAICWGTAPAPSQATPTALGTLKGKLTTNDTGLGCNVLQYGTGGNNVAIGLSALCNLGSTFSGFRRQNTAVGSLSMCRNTEGYGNVAVGYGSGCCIGTGANNVFIGNNTGIGVINGQYNIAIGHGASPGADVSQCLIIGYNDGLTAYNWLTGSNTQAIKPGAGIIDCAGSCGTNGQVLMSNGSNAICWGTAGGGSAATPTVAGTVLGCTTADNSALGCNALLSNTTGCCNIAVGFNALTANTSGCRNSAIGWCALSSNTTGYCNTATGVFALSSNQTGVTNTAYGVQTLRYNTGNFNTALGGGALFQSCSGSSNTATGAYSLLCNDTGNNNTATGSYALSSNTTGSCNVAVGDQAGCDVTSGSNNVIIGPGAQVAAAGDSCQLAIGFSAADNWLTGNSTKAIKPGAGIIDCAGSCGTAGQVLQSNGSNAIQWATPSSGFSGYNGYISTTSGTKLNVTGYQGELGTNFAGQLNIFTTYNSNAAGNPAWTPGSNALIFLNGFNGVGTSTIQAMNTSTGTFAVESVIYPAYTDITVTFTPTVTTDRMDFYIKFADATGNGGPGNGPFFTPFLTIF